MNVAGVQYAGCKFNEQRENLLFDKVVPLEIDAAYTNILSAILSVLSLIPASQTWRDHPRMK